MARFDVRVVPISAIGERADAASLVSVSSNAGIVTLSELIAGERYASGHLMHLRAIVGSLHIQSHRPCRKYPLTRSEFRRFLQTQCCEEQFDFLADVYDMGELAVANPKLTAATAELIKQKYVSWSSFCSNVLLLIVPALHSGRYIVSQSEREINISGALRTRILAEIDVVIAKPDDAQSIVRAFKPAVQEIQKLITDGRYLKSFEVYAAQNLSHAQRRQRLIIGIIGALVSLALFLGLWLSLDEHVSRLARVSTFLTNFFAVSFVLSGQMGI